MFTDDVDHSLLNHIFPISFLVQNSSLWLNTCSYILPFDFIVFFSDLLKKHKILLSHHVGDFEVNTPVLQEDATD